MTTWRASSIGAGVLAAARAEGKGRVVGEFSTGFYVRLGAEVFAVGGPSLPSGPLHLCVHRSAPVVDDGSDVIASPNWLQIGCIAIELADAMPWYPVLPSIIPDLRDIDCRPPVELEPVWSDVVGAVAVDDLAAATAILQGRGGGLTPTGDDVLAGLFLLNVGLRAIELAASVESTELSRRFLHWAARGHSIEPVHRLLDRAAAGRDAEAQDAVAIVRSIGSSSGQALLAGLGLAATPLDRHTIERMSSIGSGAR